MPAGSIASLPSLTRGDPHRPAAPPSPISLAFPIGFSIVLLAVRDTDDGTVFRHPSQETGN